MIISVKNKWDYVFDERKIEIKIKFHNHKFPTNFTMNFSKKNLVFPLWRNSTVKILKFKL